MSPRYTVKLDVDGQEHEEIVSAPDAKFAIGKAMKLHPTRPVSVLLTDLQLEIDPGPEDTPGAATIEDFMGEDDAPTDMERLAGDVAEVVAADGQEPIETFRESGSLEEHPALEELEADGTAPGEDMADEVRRAIDEAAAQAPALPHEPEAA